jgi:hypothetical protein
LDSQKSGVRSGINAEGPLQTNEERERELVLSLRPKKFLFWLIQKNKNGIAGKLTNFLAEPGASFVVICYFL